MAATQSFSHVVPFPQSVPAVEISEISQQELVDYIEACNTPEALKSHTERLESSILARLQSGASVESGVHVAELKQNSRRTPAWKDYVKRLAERLELDGDQYCSNVLAHTKPSISFSLDVR